MTGPLWLARARLRQEASVAALAPLLLPEGEGNGVLADHRLVWSLMTTGAEARRDFLWRREAPGCFLILAPRAPEGNALFEVACKTFEPALVPGDRLGFALRANPTAARLQPGLREQRRRGKRSDVVMHALYPVAAGERVEKRPALVQEAGSAWLTRQGTRHGFRAELESLRVDGYRRVHIPRAGAGTIKFGVLDYEGTLTVDDPAQFLMGLTNGFGRARAFGCGLMLIRRA